MQDGWFYADGDKPVGPLALDAMVATLRTMSRPESVSLWHESLADWRAAKDVPQIAAHISRPPSIPKPQFKNATVQRPEPSSKNPQGVIANKNSRGKVAFFVTFAIALLVAAVMSKLIYDNSGGGIARVAGQFLGAAALLSLVTWPWRRAPRYASAAFVLAIATFSVVIGNWSRLSNGIVTYQMKAALKGITDPKEIEKVAEQNPSNAMLQVTGMVFKAAQEALAAFEKQDEGIKPPALDQPPNYATASRSELEAYRRDLKIAEDNASSIMPRIDLILKEEREKVQNFARSLRLEERLIRDFLEGIDHRHAQGTSFSSRMMSARAELYRALGDQLSTLIAQYGAFEGGHGRQIVFSDQSALERFNSAGSAASAVAKRIAELEIEGKKLQQMQQEAFERFVRGQ
jgi:hypothetical protein